MIQKNRKSRIKDETLKAFILSALFLSLFFFNLNFISAEEFGYTYLEPGENLNQVTYLNYTEVNVNNSNFWAGYTPTTYYTYIKGLLDTAYDLVYCKLTGCTMTGNLITSGNITADTYFGDWNGGNVDGNINILRSDNPSLTLVLSYIGGIARIGTDGNDNFRFITNGIDRVKIEEDGDMIVTNNITADTYFGDGSELTGISAGLWTNISDTATYNGNITTTGTRNQLGLNFWSCQLTKDSNLILTANLTKSIADGKC